MPLHKGLSFMQYYLTARASKSQWNSIVGSNIWPSKVEGAGEDQLSFPSSSSQPSCLSFPENVLLPCVLPLPIGSCQSLLPVGWTLCIPGEGRNEEQMDNLLFLWDVLPWYFKQSTPAIDLMKDVEVAASPIPPFLSNNCLSHSNFSLGKIIQAGCKFLHERVWVENFCALISEMSDDRINECKAFLPIINIF